MSEEQQIQASAVAGPRPKRAPTLYLIITIKAMKGVGLLLLALGFYKLRNENLPEVFDNFLRWLHLDPERKFFATIGDRLENVTPQNVRTATWGTLAYGVLLLTEAVGLAFRAGWAVWLAVGQSAFFIPIEIRELIIHPNASKTFFSVVLLLCLNILIVWYLYVNRHRLIKHHHH
jgi:uncharacterized membrane protein (DUF2068 family)